VCKHFQNSADKQSATCQLCSATIQLHGGTSNLRSHIRHKHPTMEHSSATPQQQRERQPTLTQVFSAVQQQASQEDITRALTDFVVQAYVPMKLVEHDRFRRICPLSRRSTPSRAAPRSHLASGCCTRQRNQRWWQNWKRASLRPSQPTRGHLRLQTRTWPWRRTSSTMTGRCDRVSWWREACRSAQRVRWGVPAKGPHRCVRTRQRTQYGLSRAPLWRVGRPTVLCPHPPALYQACPSHRWSWADGRALPEVSWSLPALHYADSRDEIPPSRHGVAGPRAHPRCTNALKFHPTDAAASRGAASSSDWRHDQPTPHQEKWPGTPADRRWVGDRQQHRRRAERSNRCHGIHVQGTLCQHYIINYNSK